MSRLVGQPVDRVDGPLKVTGQARFTTDLQVPGTVYGSIVSSTIARGRIREFDLRAAERVPGFIGVLTHRNALRLQQEGDRKKPWALSGLEDTLQNDSVRFDHQPVAVAIAETPEGALRAAELVKVEYEALPPRISLESEWEKRFNPGSFIGEPADFGWGDFEQAWQEAPVRVDAVYSTPWEHHNPIELHNTLARWDGEQLEVHDSTQFVGGVQLRLATLLGMDPDKIRVICRYVGGGFGSKGQTWPHVMLAVMAAKLVERPVHLTLTREQLFGVVGHRSFTHQRVRLAAGKDGTLLAHGHESTSQTSEFADYVEAVGRSVTKLYACPNTQVRQRLIRLDTNTPTFMRAPGDSTGLFALESAMDELAEALNMDPLTLRLRNYTETEPGSGRPWSSKGLRACYEQAAQRFGWAQRSPEVRSMQDGHELLGWGMASATLHTSRSSASARVRLHADGTVTIETATHELGTGIDTVLTQIVADALGLSPERITCHIGDTALPAAPLSAGSQTTASVAPAVQEAALALRAALIELALQDGPLRGLSPQTVEVANGRLYDRGHPEEYESLTEVLHRHRREELQAERQLDPTDEDELPQAMRSFGCHFVEVRVDPDLGTARVSRYVGAFAAGRIMNAQTAHSQLTGGVVWGIGMALMEQAVRDPRRARVMNANLADYLIPVNADVPDLEVIVVEEEDPVVNPLGAKGLGELGITGMAAAIANAVYHATGRRIRDLPITPDKLL